MDFVFFLYIFWWLDFYKNVFIYYLCDFKKFLEDRGNKLPVNIRKDKEFKGGEGIVSYS